LLACRTGQLEFWETVVAEACEQGVQHHPTGPDVSRLAVIALMCKHFWRNILWSACRQDTRFSGTLPVVVHYPGMRMCASDMSAVLAEI